MDFIENVSLAKHSNFKIGGPARYFCEAKSEEDIVAALAQAKQMGLPVFILAGGTNILFSDAGFLGLVLKPEIKFLKREGNTITAGAGVLMSDLLSFAAENNLSGLEWAGGLPGTLGGAIRGNAGAFGGEIKDNIVSVRSLNLVSLMIPAREEVELGWGYRSSIFKKGREELILSAILKLWPGEKEKINLSYAEKINYRNERQPLDHPNIGSIFKNVPLEKFGNNLSEELKTHIKTDPFPVIPAAVLISQAGLKGLRGGGAQVSEKHANFIVNIGGAKATDVLSLIDAVKRKVLEKFGVELEPEVELVGF